MRITPTSGLSQDEIDRIINEAQTSAESDRALRDKVDLNNKLTSLVKNTQRAFVEFGGLLSKEAQENGQLILTEGEAAIGAEEVGAIRMGLDAVDRLPRRESALARKLTVCVTITKRSVACRFSRFKCWPLTTASKDYGN